MRLPKRFALSTLLLLMLVVAAVFGYAQWRRQWLFNELAQLKAKNVQALEIEDHWFWPTPSQFALVVWTKDADGKLLQDGKHVTAASARRRYKELRNRIDVMGSVEVHPALLTEYDSKVGVVNAVRPFATVDELFE